MCHCIFISFNLQLLPLLLVTDHEHGGYNMDPSEIGVILSAAAVLQLLFQVLDASLHFIYH